MSAVTVTYQELPPMASWVSDGQDHGVNMGENCTGQMITFTDTTRAQYRDHNGWNTFAVEGLEVKCDTENAAGEWAMNGPVLDDAHPIPYHQPSYTTGPYSYDCAGPGGGKKRYSHMRCGTVSSNGISTSVNGTGQPNMAPEELCLVCGDKASGYHYNALTCEGCKGFFRRSITRKAMYYCKYGGHCDIDMYMRRKCQACRLRKCLEIGMRPELVIPEEQCRLKRESKNKMRTINNASSSAASTASNCTTMANSDERKSNSPQQVTSTDTLSPNPPIAGLTPEQRELVHRLVRYQEQYELPSDQDLAKLSTFRADPSQSNPTHTHFQHLAELTILNVQLIVEFTKRLPGFLTLSKDDQLTLLKACSTEILMLKTARRYDHKTDTVVLGNRSTSWAYSRDAYKQAGMGSATDAIFEFSKSMAKLRVDAAEFALLTAISIFSERPGLIESRKVEDIQEVYTATLQSYIDVHRPKNRTVFARLLMKLTDLRTLGCEQADVLCSLKMTNGQCRFPIVSPEPAEDAELERESKADQRQDNQQDGGFMHRVPNVRIKVEPLAGRVSGQYSEGMFECHSTMYTPDQDDTNNDHYPSQHNEEEHRTISSTSNMFMDTSTKWN